MSSKAMTVSTSIDPIEAARQAGYDAGYVDGQEVGYVDGQDLASGEVSAGASFETAAPVNVFVRRYIEVGGNMRLTAYNARLLSASLIAAADEYEREANRVQHDRV